MTNNNLNKQQRYGALHKSEDSDPTMSDIKHVSPEDNEQFQIIDESTNPLVKKVSILIQKKVLVYDLCLAETETSVLRNQKIIWTYAIDRGKTLNLISNLRRNGHLI
jgi:hypothetical protein